MTTYNKSTLKTFFQTADVPTGQDYANFIDSYINIVETSSQAMAGPLSATEIITPRVSAVAGNFTTSLNTTALTVTDTATLGSVTINNDDITGVDSITMSGLLESSNLRVNTNALIYGTSDFYSQADFLAVANLTAGYNLSGSGSSATIDGIAILNSQSVIVSAAGSAQSTAAPINPNIRINYLTGATDGQATGFLLPSPSSAAGGLGTEQLLVHQSSVSANLWPNVGCRINGLSTNVPFPLVANTPYYLIYASTSAYAVK